MFTNMPGRHPRMTDTTSMAYLRRPGHHETWVYAPRASVYGADEIGCETVNWPYEDVGI